MEMMPRRRSLSITGRWRTCDWGHSLHRPYRFTRRRPAVAETTDLSCVIWRTLPLKNRSTHVAAVSVSDTWMRSSRGVAISSTQSRSG